MRGSAARPAETAASAGLITIPARPNQRPFKSSGMTAISCAGGVIEPQGAIAISRAGGIVSAMKFTLEASSRVNLIRGYSSREIRIGERRLQASCIITADKLISDWGPASFAELLPAHLETILALQPELVLLGTGPTQRFPPASMRSELTARGVGLEVMDLGAACRTFNILVQEERRVAAALFLK
jgi:uncharacterized protein